MDLAQGAPVLRYNVVIGHAIKAIPAGSWVHERLLQMPPARELEGLPIATIKPDPLPPLEGYTFEGYRNADGSVGSRNILAITTTVQCVAGVLEFAVKPKLLELGFEIVGNTPAEFAAFQAAEFARWKKVIEVGKITAD